LITNTKYWFYRLDGFLIKFFKNACIIFDKNYKLLSNKIKYPLIKEFYNKININKKLYKKISIYIKNYI
jgi:ribosomal protein L14